MAEIDKLFRLMVQQNASDMHLSAGTAPYFRIHGEMVSLNHPPLQNEAIQALVFEILNEKQKRQFVDNWELDTSYAIKGVGRFRVNVFMQRRGMGGVFRVIPEQVKTAKELNLPQHILDLIDTPRGLVLVTGPTGSGKSTTLAGMIDKINNERSANIVTIEDPIEFVHPDKSSIVSQREVGLDTDSFTDALKYVVRQNPDIILIGEMRDIETMNVGLQAAETGHLVFSTLHTSSASETLDRIINLFPPHEKPQLCLRLANSLRGVISQKLLPRVDTEGRVAAVEIMIATPTIAKLIEEGRAGNLYSAIQEGNFWGMQTMNQCLIKYFRAGIIGEDDALNAAGNATELKQLLRRPN